MTVKAHTLHTFWTSAHRGETPPPGGATDRFIRLKGADCLLGGGNLPFPTDNCPVADGAAAAQPLVAIVCS